MLNKFRKFEIQFKNTNSFSLNSIVVQAVQAATETVIDSALRTPFGTPDIRTTDWQLTMQRRRLPLM